MPSLSSPVSAPEPVRQHRRGAAAKASTQPLRGGPGRGLSPQAAGVGGRFGALLCFCRALYLPREGGRRERGEDTDSRVMNLDHGAFPIIQEKLGSQL